MTSCLGGPPRQHLPPPRLTLLAPSGLQAGAGGQGALFVFGTLMDPDVLALVTGERGWRLRPARLQGWRRERMAGRSYPLIRPHPGGWVDGMLADRLSAAALWRLNDYEGPEYRLSPLPGVVVQSDDGGFVGCRASLYLCQAGPRGTGLRWALPDWQRRAKRNYLRQLSCRMGLHPVRLAGRLAARGYPAGSTLRT